MKQFKEFKHYAGFKMMNPEMKGAGPVKISGIASTFSDNPDRQGDVIMPTAFDKTIENFMRKNPMLLADHMADCMHVIGAVIEMKATKVGLEFTAEISSATDEFTKMCRTKIREGYLRTASIGGRFYYDGNKIYEVDLYELSVIPIPANADALFEKKSLAQTICETMITTETAENTANQAASINARVKDVASGLLRSGKDLSPSLVKNLEQIILKGA